MTGNIFDSKCQVLVNPVNCVGVMGKGLALEFKRKFPKMFEEYKQHCKDKEMLPGRPVLYNTGKRFIQYDEYIDRLVLCFPTKDHWKHISEVEYITGGLYYIRNNYKRLKIKSIAFPALGCGCGQLRWDIMLPIMETYLCNLDIDVEIYSPAEEGKK
jgi:O-acetyl-ADP-ribose deacetylase (regulator of RNase III)